MLRNIVITAGALVTAVLLAEAAALLIMKSSVNRYATYWRARAGQPGEFVYVALGDSAAQGIGASSPERGYVGLIAQRIEVQTGKRVRVVNLSRTGATLEDVLNRQLPQLKSYTPDLVTMEIGANDLLSYDASKFRQQYAAILDGLPADRTVVATMPYFGGRINVQGRDHAASDIITSLAEQRGFRQADLYDGLKARDSLRVYAADYFHPSNHGHHIWSEAFWVAISDTGDLL